MTDRIDIIAQNGNSGEHYTVFEVAKLIAGDTWNQPLHGINKGKKRWEIYIPKAIAIVEYLEGEKV